MQVLYLLTPTRRQAVQTTVDELLVEVKSFETKKGSSSQLRWLALSAEHACQELRFPAAQRDVLQQLVLAERFYCMAVAFLIWDELINHPPQPGESKQVHGALMGCFTTNPSVAAHLWEVGIPVWYMRLVGSLNSEVYVVNHVSLQLPSGIATEAMDNALQLYLGLPGKRHLDVVCQGALRLGIEAIPMPADYAPVNNATDEKISIASVPPAAGPQRTKKAETRKMQPCTPSLPSNLVLI
jgi:hypothetical protein